MRSNVGSVLFLEVLEWFDPSGTHIVQRIPDKGSAEIKFGAQLIVRESQAAVFFYKGKAYDAFPPGRHTLKTANIPILTKVLAIPWGMTSPLRAEVYFVNMKIFPDLKWGTRDPVAFRDKELGLIRLRAFGMFNIQVVQPVLFINSLVGTQGLYTTEHIEQYLSRVIVSRFNDYMGEKLDTLFNLPGKYNDITEGMEAQLQADFGHFGIRLVNMYINAITPPPEVQQAIDDKSRLSVFTDLDRLMKMKAALAIEKAAQAQGEAGSAMGMGLGFMMPAMFGNVFQPQSQQTGAPASAPCPECGIAVPSDSKFCPQCGHQILVFAQCAHCGKNIPPHAAFCTKCGKPVHQQPQPRICTACKTENLQESIFCNQCGVKLE